VVESQSAQPDGTHLHPHLVEQYKYRAKAVTHFSNAVDKLSTHRKAHFAVVLSAITAAGTELLRMHRAREIHDSVLHTLEQELDLEEIAARRFAGRE
jgi:CPA1 family monovalent cation:H+ antiporter